MRGLRLLVTAIALISATVVEACEETDTSATLVDTMQQLLCTATPDYRPEIYPMLFAGFDGQGDIGDVERLSRVLNQLELNVWQRAAAQSADEAPAAADELVALLSRTPALITGLRASVVRETFDEATIRAWCQWRRLDADARSERNVPEIMRVEEAVRCGL